MYDNYHAYQYIKSDYFPTVMGFGVDTCSVIQVSHTTNEGYKDLEIVLG